MKRFLLLFIMVVTASLLLAAAPKAPSAFEIRLVVPEAGPATEDHAFSYRPGEPGETLHLRKIPLIDQSALASAEVLKHPIGDAVQFVLQINFNESGRELLARVTRENLGKRLAFLVDGKVLLAPKVMAVIREGKAQIDSFDGKETAALAAKINGALAKK